MKMIDASIETYTGKHFNIFNKDEDDLSDICIEDIAHGLSMICRYNGQSKFFYSVAEHSVLCSYLVPEEFAFDALMHDCSEAYIADMPKPFKQYIDNYKDIESVVQNRIAKKFNFDAIEPEIVKQVDTGILWLEAQLLMKSKGSWWDPTIEEHYKEFVEPNLDNLPDGGIGCWYPPLAEKWFLERFKELSMKR